jgi:hypothetical protein
MNFSNRAMKVVSYPFVILCKSAKIIPVIVVGTLRGVYKPTNVQFGISFAITGGLILFNFAKVSYKQVILFLCRSKARIKRRTKISCLVYS